MDNEKAIGKTYDNEMDIIPAFLVPDNIIKREQERPNIYPHNHASQEDEYHHIDTESDMVIRERLYHAIESEHIDLFMQPIVTLPQRHTSFYEFFGRLRVKPGQYIPAKDYMPLANEEHIISGLDTLLLINCLKVLKKRQLRVSRLTSYFINIKPFTLRNQGFMTNLVLILSHNRNIAHTLIFEMHYNDFLLLSPAEKKILNELSNIGCRFSIDHTDDIPTDIDSLIENNISFIKVNAKTLKNKGKTEQGFNEILNQKQGLKNQNIDLIIEKIENESDLLELLDYDIKYGQGFLFGRPDFSGVYTTHPQ